MANRSTSVAALLAVIAAATVFQATSAYVVPEVVMMRIKRNPEPMRSFSFSGFNPNGQMSAFTGLAEYPMFGGSYGQASPYSYGPQPATQDPYGSPAATQDSYGPPPSGVAGQQTPAADSANKQQEYGPPKSGASVDSKEQINNSVEQGDNKKQYRGRDGPSSNAEASFNAWFPIMFGVFPNGAGNGNGQSGSPINRGNNNQGQGQGQDQGNSYGGNGYERSSGTTVIANSVSNGRHGVATSHAIAYGNPRSSQ
ncbi:velvet complex subunit B-like [Melanaphis sacchari]|uniref:velvet complex subunit B-like n=1 Tax=Melanaphis sacchari TaxID=742174 RepID=UPI000DC12F2C|nr:velvet complex subunit B-like [Melanaphis sacchari]